jgi:hypothetical protein
MRRRLIKSGPVLVTSRVRSVALQLVSKRDIASTNDASVSELSRMNLGKETEKVSRHQ